MRTFDATQTSIVASAYKLVSWLFDVAITGTTYYWSTKAMTFGGHNYTFRIIPESFDGVTLRRIMSEQDLVNGNLLEFEVTNKSNTLVASDFIDKSITLSLVISDGTDEAVIRTWKFAVVRCESAFQRLRFYCEDFLQRYLRSDCPDTKLVRELSQSTDPEPQDTLCVPVPVGTCYVPLRSVFINADGRYYVLGPVDGGITYTITRVRSPRSIGEKSEWTSAAGYAFTQATKVLDGENVRVFQPIVADADNDGVVDSVGLWEQGDLFLDMPTQFSRSDTAALTSPEQVIEFMLEAFGVASADIDTGAGSSFAMAGTTFAGWGLTWNGAFYYKEPQAKVLARLLNMCHATIVVSNKVELRVLSKTSRKTFSNTPADILSRGQGFQFESTFRYEPIIEQSNDSAYIAFQVANEAQDAMLRVLVSAKGSYDSIGGDVLELPFVQDSQSAQKLGILYFQRRFLEKGRPTYDSKGTCLALDPDDVVTIGGTNYGGSYDALINSMHIHRDVSITFECTRFKEALDDWADLAPAAVAPSSDTSTNIWQPVIAGPDSTLAGGGVPNQLRGRLRVGETGNYILLDPAEPIVKMVEGGQVRVEIGDIGVGDYAFRLTDHGGNVIMLLDGAGTNTIAGWTLTSTTISKTDRIILDSANGRMRVGTGASYIDVDGANTRIRSSNYSSGTQGAGFNLDSNLLEVGNIACRGIFRSAVFQKAAISAVGGNVLIPHGADVLDAAMTAADASNLVVKGTETFVNGDIVRLKDGVDDEWMTVSDASGAPTYVVARDQDAQYGANANPAWPKGTAVVNYGQSGDGAIYLTASDTGAPFLSVVKHAGAPWDTLTTTVRIGNLNGFLGYATDKYGIAIGEATKYLKYDPTGGLEIKGTVIITGATSSVGGVLASSIAGWAHASDTTTIDGGDIYAGSITLGAINGAGGGTLTITAGKIAINTADALEIQASGNVKVLNGGDIVMQSTSASPSRIVWSGANYDIEWSLQSDAELDGTTGSASFTVAPGAIYRAHVNVYIAGGQPGFTLRFNGDSGGNYNFTFHGVGSVGGSAIDNSGVNSGSSMAMVSDSDYIDHLLGEIQFATEPDDDTDVLVKWHLMAWYNSSNYRIWNGMGHYNGASDLASVVFTSGTMTGKIFLERMM